MTIQFDKAKLNKLREAQAAAVEAGLEVFMFEGQEIYVPYGNYLIEYLEDQLE